jgi:hypothetical protein
MNLVADRSRSLRRQAKALLKLPPPPEILPASAEALALAQALRTLPIRQRKYWSSTTWSTSRSRRSPTRWACPTARSRASCPAAATRWRPSSARLRRCSTPHERPAGTTSGTGRCGRPPQPHPRPPGTAAPRPPSAAAADRGTAMLVVLAVVAGMVGTDPGFVSGPGPKARSGSLPPSHHREGASMCAGPRP